MVKATFLAALGIVGGGATLHVGLALLHHRNAVGRRDLQELHRHVAHTHLLADGLGKLQAQVQRIAHGLFADRVHIRKRHRRFAVGEHDLAARLDALQHAIGLCRKHHRAQRQRDAHQCPAWCIHPVLIRLF
jgi:hypothetical protein